MLKSFNDCFVYQMNCFECNDLNLVIFMRSENNNNNNEDKNKGFTIMYHNKKKLKTKLKCLRTTDLGD